MRGGTRSEGARTPRLRRNVKQPCGERNVDVLYLRAASQPKLTEKAYAQLKSTNKCYTMQRTKQQQVYESNDNPKTTDEYVLLHHKKPDSSSNLHQQQNPTIKPNTVTTTHRSLLRQTLLAITDNFVSLNIAVRKGDVVTLLACRQVIDKHLSQPMQWFYVRARDGAEGYIPAECAGHGFL